MTKIDTSPAYYYSQRDEDNFFQWAQEIACVISVDQGYLHIEIQTDVEAELRELLALLTRYGLSIEPLRELVDQSNEHWFSDPNKYWNAGS